MGRRFSEPLLPFLADRSTCFWPNTTALLLRGWPMVPGPFYLSIGDEELFADLLVWYLEKEGSADLNTLVS
jgi:hypothetical protein